MFYDNYVRLCAQKGLTPSVAAKEIGINKAAVSNWKHRKNNPSDVTIQRVADYFGVTVSDLTGEAGKKEKADPQEGTGLSPVKKEAWDLIQKMDDETAEKFIKIARVVLGDETL